MNWSPCLRSVPSHRTKSISQRGCQRSGSVPKSTSPAQRGAERRSRFSTKRYRRRNQGHVEVARTHRLSSLETAHVTSLPRRCSPRTGDRGGYRRGERTLGTLDTDLACQSPRGAGYPLAGDIAPRHYFSPGSAITLRVIRGDEGPVPSSRVAMFVGSRITQQRQRPTPKIRGAHRSNEGTRRA